jgi:predicted SnoaL-like aldol condensation-catalyzing enzyme
MVTMSSEQTKSIILEAFDTLFNKRDYAKANDFWSEDYIQHSAFIAPGRDGLFDLIRSAPETLRYENDRIMVDGDWAMLHGRFSGNGRPRAWIATDIVRLENGRLIEHWDVLQDEVTAKESLSGLPMFGTAFATPQEPEASAEALTIDDARRITAPLYDALNEPGKKDVAALLAQAANDDYRSFSTDENFLTRDQLAEVFAGIGASVPDLRWTIMDMFTVGDRIIVRGRATGTPTGDFFGHKATGRRFDTMAIDVFTVKDGKLASAYHIENWIEALQQMGSRPVDGRA